jgi:hypothetical protein
MKRATLPGGGAAKKHDKDGTWTSRFDLALETGDLGRISLKGRRSDKKRTLPDGLKQFLIEPWRARKIKQIERVVDRTRRAPG